MKNLALKRIQAMKPYQPPIEGRAGFGGLLLDFNERTIGPKERLYPEYADLNDKIAAYCGVAADEVMVTNGTDQAIDIIIRTFSDRDDTVVIPEPSFAMYGQWARINGNRIVNPLYDKDTLAFPLREVLRAIDVDTKLVVVCNPNSPTGTLATLEDITTIARKAKQAVVYVDEAYFEFSGVSAVGLIGQYPNIVVSRTFSKAFGLAGLRIGYIVAAKQNIEQLLKVRGPYDVNQAACQAAADALRDTKAARQYSEEVMKQAKPLLEQFFTDKGIRYYPSAGNFILFRPENAGQLVADLRREGIALRPQDKPNIEDTVRVTIGTKQQMEDFVDAYKKTDAKSQKYALLDRDGTLIDEPQDTFQIDSLDRLRILDGAIVGLQKLQQAGYQLVLVSNQNGIGTPSFPQEDFDKPQNAMLKIFADNGITFAEVFVCPHKPEVGCSCRKPKAGLLDEWLKTARLDQKQSFMCGDRATDKELADNLGIKYVAMKTNGNFLEALKEIVA